MVTITVTGTNVLGQRKLKYQFKLEYSDYNLAKTL